MALIQRGIMWPVQRSENRELACGSVTISGDAGFIGGLVTNVSKSGLCAYVQEEFTAGENVSVYSQSFDTRGPRVASVRWCIRFVDDLYKVGLLFPKGQ